jgi:hypothetical protein
MKIKIIWACLTTCLFFVQNLNAEVIRYDNSVTGESKYSWEEACLFLTKRTSPLIDYKSISELSCMGETKQVIDFCDHKEIKNPYFARAIVDKKNRTVRCQSSKRVILKWKCEDQLDKYCKDPEVGCFLLREKMARRLKLAHKSLTDDGKVLNCYFDTQKNSINLNI